MEYKEKEDGGGEVGNYACLVELEVVLEGNLGAESHAAGVLLLLVFLRHARRRLLLRIHDPASTGLDFSWETHRCRHRKEIKSWSSGRQAIVRDLWARER
jgi:hypothetical protein